MIREQAPTQREAREGRPHHPPGKGKSAAANWPSRQERLFFALLGGCLGLTLVASAMLRLVTG
ncbi:hypothetical protein [Bosea sp. (in: a-proteobacteria)]|uniref:hypothetical protein n=1 Tax=Bosea sp. (in: a-proteobacteria) TaxID=1871050 RepID=UPI002FC79974